MHIGIDEKTIKSIIAEKFEDCKEILATTVRVYNNKDKAPRKFYVVKYKNFSEILRYARIESESYDETYLKINKAD